MKFALILFAAAAFFTVNAAEATVAAQPALQMIEAKDCKPTEKLTVLKAVYGTDKTNCYDVTEAIQKRLDKKQDIFCANIFGKDPAPGKGKFLEIIYSVNNQVKTVRIKEHTTVKFADFK